MLVCILASVSFSTNQLRVCYASTLATAVAMAGGVGVVFSGCLSNCCEHDISGLP